MSDRGGRRGPGIGGIVVKISGGTINGSSSEFKQSIQEAVIEGVTKKRNLSGLNAAINKAVQ